MEKQIEKVYFTLKEAAEIMNISVHCVRDRCKTFGIIGNKTRHRNSFVIRLSIRELLLLKKIHDLITIEGMRGWRVKDVLKIRNGS